MTVVVQVVEKLWDLQTQESGFSKKRTILFNAQYVRRLDKVVETEEGGGAVVRVQFHRKRVDHQPVTASNPPTVRS